MRRLWWSAEYERTCAECGYAWRVPRAFARRRVQSISAFDVAGASRLPGRGGPGGGSVSRAELQAEVQSSMEIGERWQAFRACPKCGSENYRQKRA